MSSTGSTLIAGLVAACALGCSSTGIGNPSGKTTLSLSIVSDDEAEPGAEDPDVALPQGRLRHVVLVFQHLRWLPCDAEQEPVVVPGQIIVNLATGRVEPEPASVTVPPSGFCGLDAPLAPAGWPAALVGRSVFFAGVREDGTLFLLYSSVEGTLRLRAREGVVWGGSGDDESLVWAHRPRRWLTPDELEGVESVPVGEIEGADQVEAAGLIERVIPIDVDRHPGLLALIRARLAGRSSMHVDTNHNGEFDADEHGDGGWLGSGLPELD